MKKILFFLWPSNFHKLLAEKLLKREYKSGFFILILVVCLEFCDGSMFHRYVTDTLQIFYKYSTDIPQIFTVGISIFELRKNIPGLLPSNRTSTTIVYIVLGQVVVLKRLILQNR